jgi:parallel beta-helix repeat protein
LRVDSGTYSENVIVDKSITLIADSASTVIEGNDIDDTLHVTADNVVISGFTITGTVGTSGTGIFLDHVSGCMIIGNIISANPDFGIAIGSDSYGSSKNTISGNRLIGNNVGIHLSSLSTANLIYHNLIAQNTIQAEAGSGSNSWDNGYPSGGNCWGEYRGEDHNHGPDQNIAGSDGINDAQYAVNRNNVDLYPLYVYLAIHQFQVDIDTQLTPITIETNAGITEISSTFNTLSFTAGGLGGFGSSGYLRAFVPSSQTTYLQVTIDSVPVEPLILEDGANSYVFFQFPFSSHSIIFLFGAEASVFFSTPAINGNTVDINGGAMPGSKVIDNGIDWNWGDGTPVEHHYFPNSHTYTSGGTFTLTVTAHYEDANGPFTASESVNIATLPEGQKSGGFNVRIDNSEGGGTVSYESSLSDGTVPVGSHVDLYLAAFDTIWGIKATPDSGRDFAQLTITGNDVSFQKEYTQLSNPTVVLVDSDGTITPTFIPSLQVPEYLYGALLSLAACFAAFILMKKPHINLRIK